MRTGAATVDFLAAFKYSPAGSPVVVRAQCEKDELILTVQDGGIGISKEDQPVIFEPFFRSISARRSGVPGVGLGLPIVQRIAESLQGRIDFESAPGSGSTFRLRVPLQPVSLGVTRERMSSLETTVVETLAAK
jgi:signal transduction histidine kinase